MYIKSLNFNENAYALPESRKKIEKKKKILLTVKDKDLASSLLSEECEQN